MKSLLILPMLVIFFSSQAQDPLSILKKSKEKCLTIDNGYIEIEKKMKYMDVKDTVSGNYKAYFKKYKNDTIINHLFHYESLGRYKNYLSSYLYNGKELVTYSRKDSIGTIKELNKLPFYNILTTLIKHITYSPVQTSKAFPFPDDSLTTEKNNQYSHLGIEKINGKDCHRIRMLKYPAVNQNDMLKRIQTEYDFWIATSDFLPLQYTQTFVYDRSGDTVIQFDRNTLKQYRFNIPEADSQTSFMAIPSYCILKNEVPTKKTDLLVIGTNAPEFTLPSTENKIISLSQFKGKLVLLDFFYKSCYPCLMSIPSLNRLYEKYQSAGLEIVAIDPYDKPADEIGLFMKKREVKYHILMEGESTAKSYQVSGYPTQYLISPEGKIILAMEGFGEMSENKLDGMIRKFLPQPKN